MHTPLTALDDALAGRWVRSTPWHVSGARATAQAIHVVDGTAACLTAVRCDADGMATASLAREIAVLEYLAHQPSVVPLHEAGRHAGYLYAVSLCTDGMSLAAQVARDGPMAEDDVVTVLIAIADLLHFMHGAGIAHTAIGADAMFRCGQAVLLGGFHAAVRLAAVPDAPQHIAFDVLALAGTARTLLGVADGPVDMQVSANLAAVLERALSPDHALRFQTAISFAQALCTVRDAAQESGEVRARDAGDDDVEADRPLTEGAARSLCVLHALLDRAEVDEQPPEPGDPLVQRCWTRALAYLSPDDARLVALRVRWQLLADRDPVGALHASQPARDAVAVWPYRARALAALGRAAEARTLAVRTWFDDVALDVAAMRSLAVALVLTRAFDLASMISVTECATGVADPVLSTMAGGPAGMPLAGRAAQTIASIAAAIDQRMPWTAELLVDPQWDALRGDPAFASLVGRARTHWTS